MISNMNSKVRVLLVAALIGLSIGLPGCATTVASGGYHHHPSHGWYDYYYYPTVDIYLDISGGYYWYQDHDHWKRVKRLPPHLRPHDHERVFLRLDTDRPHTYHQQHRYRYREHPQRRDDLRGEVQRRESAPGLRPDRPQVRNDSRPGARDRSPRPTARTTVRRDEPAPLAGRREVARQASRRPVPPVQRTQRSSHPHGTTDTPGDQGTGAASDRKHPPLRHRGIGRIPQATPPGDRKSSGSTPTQRRNNNGQRQRLEPNGSGDAVKERRSRGIENHAERRREQAQGDDMKGTYRRTERIGDGEERNRIPRLRARNDI